MAKRVMILALALLFVIPAMSFAKDMTGKWGLGYFSNDAPVGARFWVNEKVGVDLGVGFSANGYVVSEGAPPDVTYSTETATSFWVDLGVPYVVFPSDRANFFVRPGVVFGIIDDMDPDLGTQTVDETWTQITVSLTPGAEVFFGEHFSLEAGHGIALDLTTPPDAINGGESTTDIRTFDASVTYLGFHFYFK